MSAYRVVTDGDKFRVQRLCGFWIFKFWAFERHMTGFGDYYITEFSSRERANEHVQLLENRDKFYSNGWHP